MSARLFLTTARLAIQYTWKGIEPQLEFQQILEARLRNNNNNNNNNNHPNHPTHACKVVIAEVHGKPHETPGNPPDPLHASMLLKDDRQNRLTSVHVYRDGRVVFSRKEYNSN